MKGVTT